MKREHKLLFGKTYVHNGTMFGNLFHKSEDGQTSPAQPAVTPVTQSSVPISPAASTQVTPVPNDPTPLSPDAPTGLPPVASTSSSLDPATKQDVSVLSHLDARSSQALTHAQEEATRLKKELIEPDLLLYGILFDQEIFALLQKESVDVGALSKEIQAKQTPGNFLGQPKLSDQTKSVFDAAYKDVKGRGVAFISPEDLLVALASLESMNKALSEKGIQKDKLVASLAKNPTYHTGKKSVLEQYGIDLTQQARDGKLDPIAGRDKEIERMVHILLRRSKNNPIIIGEAGVGKTAIVEGLAQSIVGGTAPKDLSGKRIIQMDLASLVAGASHRGEFEERLRDVIKETIEASGEIILFIDEIHTLIGAGDEGGALDASNIVKPYLARGQLQIIGTTTTSEYRKHFEKDKAFERRFQPILVDEPTEEVAVEMLQIIKPKYEKFHSVTFSDETLKDAVHLSKKYIGERFLPDKAVDLMDEAAADVKLQHSTGKKTDTAVVKSDIEKVVSSWTGIPITKLTEDEGEKLLHLAELIHKRLIGQEEAVQSVTEAVQRGRIGLASPTRPIASFIFLGPTGVGKTELAKTLAEILFGKEDALVRLDMSEYMEKHEVAKLIGAPPGYVGYEEGGQLTEAVRRKPYSIVLLDEIEKAHPDVFNILLQLLEDGRLTDNKGNTISFKNTIIIATSNIGSALIQQQMSKPHATEEEYQKDFADLNSLLSDELHKFFKPELLNRFDEVVVFKPLAQADMASIAKNNIAKTAHLLQEQGLDLQITQSALMELAKEGYDPVYGARPLRRLIQTSIENPIAVKLIGKTFAAPDVILVGYDAAKSEFTFAKGSATPGGAKPDASPVQGEEVPSSDTKPGETDPMNEKNPADSSKLPPTGVPSPQVLSSNTPGVSSLPPITEGAPVMSSSPVTPVSPPPTPSSGWNLPPTQEFSQSQPDAPKPPTAGATLSAAA